MKARNGEDLIRALPYARRYARALCGSQPGGDALVAQSIRSLLAAELGSINPRAEFYRDITVRFGATADQGPGGALSLVQRQLLLLTSLEDVPVDAAAAIVGVTPEEAATLLTSARDRLRAAAATDVLIIEDEPIIAMDIEELVANCGHRVVGVAATESEAVAMAERCRPGLILADINLGAGGGNGTSAVSRIMRNHYAPVIFVTAYPERLLTGEALEPAFVITKPFEPLTLAIATYQAVTGGVRID
jgi:CheY-like chemotaxis protein